MKQELFFITLDAVDEVDRDITKGYFPTVEELEQAEADSNDEDWVEFLAFYANNPLADFKMTPSEKVDYKKTVSYCKRLLYAVPVEE